jgi:signal transduction histidine kinase
MNSIEIVKILIIDDKQKNLELISSFFSDSNYLLRTTTDPEEALQICNEFELDLILIDIRMPVDGFHVCHMIHSSRHNAKTPVIFMAERTNVDNIAKAFRMGCRDVITKPFQIDELLSKITTHSLLHINSRKIHELIKAKDKIFSIIGHDLRSPFNSLIGFSDLLIDNLSHTDNIEAQKYAQIVNKVSIKNLELLENLLTYAKDLENDANASFEKVNVNLLLSEVIQIVQPQALLKNIRLMQVFGQNEFTMGVKDLLATMIRNVLSNAVKFTPNNGNVTLSTKLVGNTIQIIISDDGIGMEQVYVDSLFDYEKKFSKEGTNGEVGSGYGLILSQEIATKHNGSIAVNSTPGEGSTFILSLPLHE